MRLGLRGIFCLLGLLSVGSVTAMASPVSWALVNVTFGGGGTVAGSFVWDADTSAFSNISIQISAAAPAPNGLLTNGSNLGGIFSFYQTPAMGNPGIWLTPASFGSLPNAGGSVPLDSGFSFAGFCINGDCSALNFNPFPTSPVVSGSLLGTPVASAVPEISTMPALILGFIGLAFLKRERRFR